MLTASDISLCIKNVPITFSAVSLFVYIYYKHTSYMVLTRLKETSLTQARGTKK